MTAETNALTNFNDNFNDSREFCQHNIQKTLAQILPDEDTSPTELHQAMRYSALNGGKHIRALLAYATYAIFRPDIDKVNIPASAIELVHTYSLVHDDLPAMDDDDLRRGKPSCHKAYNEATAILVGDALQALAFESITHDSNINDTNKVRMIAVLAQSIGSLGMVGGQAIDLQAEGKTLNITELEGMHLRKTGALIQASIEIGAIAADEHQKVHMANLRTFARAIGLAFQIQDDILDVESNTDTLGKPQGADENRNKATYTSLLGLEESKARLKVLYEEAIDAIEFFGHQADLLHRCAELIVMRNH